jgi:energy-coupling factor transporter ATP-binding protein EcfA2
MAGDVSKMERQFENLAREARFRKGIVVYGNTRDEFTIKTDEGTRYVLLAHYLDRTLHDSGFSVVGVWNPIVGLKFRSDDERRRFNTWWRGSLTQDVEGEKYDAGEPQGLDDDLPSLKEIGDLVGALEQALPYYDQAVAIIVDWTDYQFGAVQRPLAQEDRCLLERLSMLMCGREGLGRQGNVTDTPPATIMLITANLASIPPSFYQPDPRIKLFNLGVPEKKTRIGFFERHLEDLNLKATQDKTRDQAMDELADMTEGMKTVDLIQMVRLARDNRGLTPERLLNLYRFGEKRSPWEELSQEKLRNADLSLKKRVVGQDKAVEHVVNTIIKAAMGLSGIQHSSKMSKPKGALFFVGPTGVGKTELAKATAEFLFGDENACIRFDMSEYSHEESDQRLIGPPPGYVGFEEGGQLINAVLERPFSVLLFDEIEKAHPRILDKFLQILEDGRLTDGKGVTAYFSETIIIFTSNIGASEVGIEVEGCDLEKEFRHKVKDHFNKELRRPELLNRIGENIIVFNPVNSEEFRREIIKKKLAPLQETIQSKYDVRLVLDQRLYDYLEKRADISHGGRGLLNAAERDLIDPLARYIFENKQFLMKGRSIRASCVEDGKGIVFELLEE